MYKRVLAVGDVHGMYDKLIALLREVRFNPEEDLMVFLGDYIDRGPNSIKCLDHIISLWKWYPRSVMCLKGNHEWLAINCLQNVNNKDALDVSVLQWISNGGYVTMKEFMDMPQKKMKYYFTWMKSLRTHYSYKNFYFCHAGIEAAVPLSRQKEKSLLWIREAFFENYKGKRIIVVGHTATMSSAVKPFLEDADITKPQFLSNNIVLCDTGAYRVGGKLSCVDVLSKRYWQV